MFPLTRRGPGQSTPPVISTDSSDESLFEAVTCFRDRTALEILFRRHFERLCEYAYRASGGDAGAEDVVSDLFIRLYSGDTRVRCPENVKCYLFAAVRKRSKNLLRARLRRQKAEAEAARAGTAGLRRGPEAIVVMFRELESEVEQLISQLPPRRQEIFRLHRVEGLSHVQVSGVLGITPNTVKSQLSLALADLDRLRRSRGLSDRTG